MDATHRALHDAEQRFQEAVKRATLVEHSFVLGGRQVCLRFAAPAVAAAIAPAFAHLPTSPGATPDLTISIWEDATSAPHSWWQAPAVPRCDYRVAAWGTCIVMDRPNYGEQSLVESQQGRAFVCLRKSEAIYHWKQISPLRGAINACFQGRGAHMVHSAAVGDSQQAVLLAGAGGAGKSTTALHCLRDPRLYYLGDDLCLVDVAAATSTVHSLYNTIRAAPREAEAYPHLDFRSDIQGFRSEKLVAYLHPSCRDKLAVSRPLRAILLPRIGNRSVRILPASAGDAFRALAPFTLQTVPAQWRASLDLLARLSQRLPAYWLDVGPNRSEIPHAIAQFLASPSCSAAA
jgi:hypothetical protein